MSELRALRERVEMAEAGSRALDEAIGDTFGLRRDYLSLDHHTTGKGYPPTSSSIDAAVALIERKLGEDPWYALERQDSLDNKFFAQAAPKWWCGNEAIKRGMHEGAPAGTAWAKTPALALVAALLAALENAENG